MKRVVFGILLSFFASSASFFAPASSCAEEVVPAEAISMTPPKRQQSTPLTVRLRPAETSALLQNVNADEAARSPIYPNTLIRRLGPIAESDASQNRVLARWAKDLREVLNATCWYWDRGEFEKSRSCLGRIEQETIELATYRKTWMPVVSESDEQYVPSSVALEEIQLALERRAILWRQALLAEMTPSVPVSRHFSKGLDELGRLNELTRNVEEFFLDERSVSNTGEQIGSLWCLYFDTKSFLLELDACQAALSGPTRRVSTDVSTIPIPMLVSFCDRANVILSRLDENVLTEQQQAYLGTPVVFAWKEELKNWAADTVSPRFLLQEMERYEENAGMSDMEKLFRTSTRISFSQTEAFRNLGLMTHDIYGGSNVKIYVSKVLVNHLLPPSKPEVARFREVIQNQPVFGRREADFDIKMNFIPDPERLLFALDVKGSISTQSQARAFATTLFNRGLAECTAQKQIELTDQGFTLHPTQVRVEKNRLQLRNLQTDFDGIPLVSGLFRGVVQNQYEARQGGAREETRRKIVRQVKTRIDKEADERFGEFNEKYRDFLATSMTEFDLFLEKKNASTEEHWLLTSWAIRSQNSLSGNTPAPETQPGSFADVKVHESAVNAILGKLDIDGKTATVGEFRQMIADRFHQKDPLEPDENDDIRIGFAPYNPLTVRFVDGHVEISIAIDSLRLQGKTHRDFQVLVRYRPVVDENGKLVLQRDRLISLVNVRAQFVLRAVFGKIFPLERPFPLTPKFLENDERFDGLITGHCRIEKGWFAIALIGDEMDSDAEKPLVSDTTPIRRITR